MCQARYDYELTEDLAMSPVYTFYHGHFSFNAVRKFKQLNPDSFIFTFMRNPINRVLSQYYNWIDEERVMWELNAVKARSGESELFRARRHKFVSFILGMTLDEFLHSTDPDVREVTYNHQAGYLSDETGEGHPGRYMSAIDNILYFYDFVGVVELYDACLRIIELKLDLPKGIAGQNYRANVNDRHKVEGRYLISMRQFRDLEALNLYDMTAFAAAYTRLLKDYSSNLPAVPGGLFDLLQMPTLGR